ncbi:hypothetical protein [Nocardiopsis alba]|uniref:hypothetical protein n=1 Tax=Nocardiopsis alba TaxID=53437 RepID=UPI0033B5226D
MTTLPVWVSTQTPRGPRTLTRADQITSIRVRDETETGPRYILEIHTPHGWVHLGVGTTQSFYDNAATWLADKISRVSVPPSDLETHVGVHLVVVGEAPDFNGNLCFSLDTFLITSD